MSTASIPTHTEDQVHHWNSEQTASFEYVANPFGGFVHIRADYSTEFTMVDTVGETFGSSIAVYHPDPQFGGQVEPARMNWSTGSKMNPDQTRAMAWIFSLAADYAEAINDNHLEDMQKDLDEEIAKWKLEFAAAKAAKEALIEERKSKLHNIENNRYRIRKGGNWRSGTLEWRTYLDKAGAEKVSTYELTLTETGGTKTTFDIHTGIADTLQVKSGSRYINVF